MKTATLALALAASTGCAATTWPRGEWTKPGVAAAVQRHDEYECERDAVVRGGTAAARAEAFAACMRKRGYARRAAGGEHEPGRGAGEYRQEYPQL